MENQGNRIIKTISLKPDVFKEIDELRGKKAFSTFLNGFLEEKLSKSIERRGGK